MSHPELILGIAHDEDSFALIQEGEADFNQHETEDLAAMLGLAYSMVDIIVERIAAVEGVSVEEVEITFEEG